MRRRIYRSHMYLMLRIGGVFLLFVIAIPITFYSMARDVGLEASHDSGGSPPRDGQRIPYAAVDQSSSSALGEMLSGLSVQTVIASSDPTGGAHLLESILAEDTFKFGAANPDYLPFTVNVSQQDRVDLSLSVDEPLGISGCLYLYDKVGSGPSRDSCPEEDR